MTCVSCALRHFRLLRVPQELVTEHHPLPNSSRRLQTFIGPVVTVVVFIVAMFVLRHSIHEIALADVLDQWRLLPPASLLTAAALTAANYLLLTLYDVLALRYVGMPLPYRRVAPISISAFAIGHSLGIPSLSGGSIRYRAYSLAGLSTVQIATVIGFVALTFGMGTSLLVGSSLIIEPETNLAVLQLPAPVLRAIGVAFVGAPLLYIAWTVLSRDPVRIRNWTLTTPTPALATGQLLLAVADLSLLATVLYVLLPPELGISFFTLIGAFLVAIGAGALSNVPGGLGVFESVLLLLLHNAATAPLLGAVFAFRLIYYVAPLTLALILIVLQALATHRDRLRHVTRVGGGLLRGMAPQAAGMVVFLSGAALILGGSLPIATERLALLNDLVPLAILELSAQRHQRHWRCAVDPVARTVPALARRVSGDDRSDGRRLCVVVGERLRRSNTRSSWRSRAVSCGSRAASFIAAPSCSISALPSAGCSALQW